MAGCLVAAQFSELTDTPAGSIGILLLLGVVALERPGSGDRPSRAARRSHWHRSEDARASACSSTSSPSRSRSSCSRRSPGCSSGGSGHRLAADRVAGHRAGPHADGTIGRAGVDRRWRGRACVVGCGGRRELAHRPGAAGRADRRRRTARRPAATLVLFGQTLVIVAAAIAAFQASQDAGSRDGWAGDRQPRAAQPDPARSGRRAGRRRGAQGAASGSRPDAPATRGGIGRYLAVAGWPVVPTRSSAPGWSSPRPSSPPSPRARRPPSTPGRTRRPGSRSAVRSSSRSTTGAALAAYERPTRPIPTGGG